MPSAPRLNLGAASPQGSGAQVQEVVAAPNAQLQAAWLQLVKQVMAIAVTLLNPGGTVLFKPIAPQTTTVPSVRKPRL